MIDVKKKVVGSLLNVKFEVSHCLRMGVLKQTKIKYESVGTSRTTTLEQFKQMSNWDAFSYGATIGVGMSLIHVGVKGVCNLLWPEPDPTEMLRMAMRELEPPRPPIESKMLVITAKRTRKLDETDSDTETKELPRKKPKIAPTNDVMFKNTAIAAKDDAKSDNESSSSDSESDFEIPEQPAARTTPKFPVLKSKNRPIVSSAKKPVRERTIC